VTIRVIISRVVRAWHTYKVFGGDPLFDFPAMFGNDQKRCKPLQSLILGVAFEPHYNNKERIYIFIYPFPG
jgi:hypothetical protein